MWGSCHLRMFYKPFWFNQMSFTNSIVVRLIKRTTFCVKFVAIMLSNYTSCLKVSGKICYLHDFNFRGLYILKVHTFNTIVCEDVISSSPLSEFDRDTAFVVCISVSLGFRRNLSDTALFSVIVLTTSKCIVGASVTWCVLVCCGTTAIEYNHYNSKGNTTVSVRFIIKIHTILSFVAVDRFKVIFENFAIQINGVCIWLGDLDAYCSLRNIF